MAYAVYGQYIVPSRTAVTLLTQEDKDVVFLIRSLVNVTEA